MNSSHPFGTGLSGREDDASVTTLDSEIFSSSARSASAPTNMTEVDRRLHDVGVAALAAVAQFPHAVNSPSDSFLVSEIVNAVTSSGSPPDFRTMHSGASLVPGPLPGHLPPAVATSVTRPEFGFGANPGADVNMGTIARDLMSRTTGQRNTVIAPDTEGSDYHQDTVMDYDSPTMEDNPSPSPNNDELEDFLQFYPDEEEYYYKRKQRPMHEAEMIDYDLDDFYTSINYEDLEVDLPQTLGVSVADPLENHFADPLELPGPHPASIIHTSSKMLRVSPHDLH